MLAGRHQIIKISCHCAHDTEHPETQTHRHSNQYLPLDDVTTWKKNTRSTRINDGASDPEKKENHVTTPTNPIHNSATPLLRQDDEFVFVCHDAFGAVCSFIAPWWCLLLLKFSWQITSATSSCWDCMHSKQWGDAYNEKTESFRPSDSTFAARFDGNRTGGQHGNCDYIANADGPVVTQEDNHSYIKNNFARGDRVAIEDGRKKSISQAIDTLQFSLFISFSFFTAVDGRIQGRSK